METHLQSVHHKVIMVEEQVIQVLIMELLDRDWETIIN